MICPELRWYIAQGRARLAAGTPFTPQQAATLAFLLGLSEDGRATITKADLGAFIGLKERQIGTVLKELESELVGLIKSQRHGGDGKGRGANSYVCGVYATGNASQVAQPAADCFMQPSAGSAVPALQRNTQPSTGATLQPSDPSGHAAQTATKSGDVSSSDRKDETYTSEERELVLTSQEEGLRATAPKRPRGDTSERGARIDPHWELVGEDASYAARHGFLNGRAQALAKKFKNHWLNATGPKARKRNWHMAWETWVDNEVEWKGRPNGERASATAADAGNRRAKSDQWADILMQDIVGDQPDEHGRVVAVTVE